MPMMNIASANLPKGPFPTKNTTALDSAAFSYRRGLWLSVPFFLRLSSGNQEFLSTLRSLVAQIARCHRDVRCDSNRTPPKR